MVLIGMTEIASCNEGKIGLNFEYSRGNWDKGRAKQQGRVSRWKFMKGRYRGRGYTG